MDQSKTGQSGHPVDASKSKEKEMKSASVQLEPPDGGYGWVVVMACFCCNMIVEGTAWAFGALLEPLSTDFRARFTTE